MNNFKPFFGTPFKMSALFMALLAFLVSPMMASGARDDVIKDDELLLDLVVGGAELFKTINEGVIQVMQPRTYGGAGSAGSGYIIDKEGHAITNRHVTADKTVFEITFWGEQEQSRKMGYRHKGVLLAQDPGLDMALIQVEAPFDKFHPVKLGKSGDMKVGDVVATCGSPGGRAQQGNYLDPSDPTQGWLEYFNINVGVLKEIIPFEQNFSFIWSDAYFERGGREYYGTALEYLLHVDAAINHGNSGGPCFNAYGEAVGTNTWGRGPGAWENAGFSCPTDLLKSSVADILAYGRVRRPWVGIALHDDFISDSDYDQAIMSAKYHNLWFDPRPEKMKIRYVNPYSPAYEAGLREGDIIDRIDGEKMDYIFDIYKYFLNARLGQEIEFKIRRGVGKPMSMVVTVDEKKVRYSGADLNIGPSVYPVEYRVGKNQISRTFSAPLTY